MVRRVIMSELGRKLIKFYEPTLTQNASLEVSETWTANAHDWPAKLTVATPYDQRDAAESEGENKDKITHVWQCRSEAPGLLGWQIRWGGRTWLIRTKEDANGDDRYTNYGCTEVR